MKLSPKVGIELKMDKKNKNFKILNTYKTISRAIMWECKV